MGINRSRANRVGKRDKFRHARITISEHEAETLDQFVENDLVDSLYYTIEDHETCEDCEDALLRNLGILYDTPKVSDVLPVKQDNAALYELGILYDSPVAGDALPVEEDASWDIISEVSEWDVVSLNSDFSDDGSWD